MRTCRLAKAYITAKGLGTPSLIYGPRRRCVILTPSTNNTCHNYNLVKRCYHNNSTEVRDCRSSDALREQLCYLEVRRSVVHFLQQTVQPQQRHIRRRSAVAADDICQHTYTEFSIASLPSQGCTLQRHFKHTFQ